MRVWLLVLAALLWLCAPAQAQTRTERVELDFWSPPLEVRFDPATSSGPRPTILLVHGWGMSAADYEWISKDLVRRGYAVASFNMWNPFLFGPDVWASEAKRAVDKLHAVAADPRSALHAELDMSRLGVIGHSLGGATAVKLAEIDRRVRAAVALAPGADLFTAGSLNAAADRAEAPLLVVTGELDFVTPTDRRLLHGWKDGKGDRLLVEVKGADHWSFTRWLGALWPFVPSNHHHETTARFFEAWFGKHLAGGGGSDHASSSTWPAPPTTTGSPVRSARRRTSRSAGSPATRRAGRA